MRKRRTGMIASMAALGMVASPLSAAPETPALPLVAFSFDDDESGFVWFGEESNFFSSEAVRIVGGYTAVALLLLTIWGGNGRPVTP